MIGIFRRVDSEGRISLPVDYRKYLNIEAGDYVEIKVSENRELVIKCKKESEAKYEV